MTGMVAQIITPSTPSLPGVTQWPPQGEWRYEDYLRLPDDGRRYEIIEGVLYVTNAPSYDHQYVVNEIHGELRQYIKAKQLGVILTAPFEVHWPGIAQPVQPDILFIVAAAQPASGTKFFPGVPDLIVEVLSPSSYRLDQFIKFDAYERAGVKEYWLANPKTRTITVYFLPEGGREYALMGEFVPGEMVQSFLFPGLQLVVETLFVT
jgi:Uma2 family endonuclease